MSRDGAGNSMQQPVAVGCYRISLCSFTFQATELHEQCASTFSLRNEHLSGLALRHLLLVEKRITNRVFVRVQVVCQREVEQHVVRLHFVGAFSSAWVLSEAVGQAHCRLDVWKGPQKASLRVAKEEKPVYLRLLGTNIAKWPAFSGTAPAKAWITCHRRHTSASDASDLPCGRYS